MPSNPHHLDLLLLQTGNVTGDAFNIKAGSNGIFLGGVFDNAIVTLEVRPKGSVRWYSRPAGVFTDATTDDIQFWINSNLPEGDARGTITNAGASTSIDEFLLRPVIEYEYEV